MFKSVQAICTSIHSSKILFYLKYSTYEESRKLLQFPYKYNMPKDYCFFLRSQYRLKRQGKKEMLFTYLSEYKYMCVKTLYTRSFPDTMKNTTCFQSNIKAKNWSKSCSAPVSGYTRSATRTVKQAGELNSVLFLSIYSCYHVKLYSLSQVLLAAFGNVSGCAGKWFQVGIFKQS